MVAAWENQKGVMWADEKVERSERMQVGVTVFEMVDLMEYISAELLVFGEVVAMV